MKIVDYLKNNGLKRAFDVIYTYKIQRGLEKCFLFFCKNKPLKDIIMIESHNDFDCNGGAFYNYLIKNNYNKKYKIVWQLKHPLKVKLPYNVDYVYEGKPSIKRAYYRCFSKIFTYDCTASSKLREDQKSYYFTHGPVALKNCAGKVYFPDNIDYLLSPSEFYAPILACQVGLQNWKEKSVFLGYPMHDILYTSSDNELLKITDKKFSKVIIWMPTFRKGGGFNRNDSEKEQLMGIPLIEDDHMYDDLNNYLEQKDILLIIKIHPKQDMSVVRICDKSNVTVLSGEKVKILGVENYHLIKECDAMISDYSSIAFDFLHVNKPIGYVLEDEKEYKLGFVVDDPREMMAGHEINTYSDLKGFIDDIADDNDVYKEERQSLLNKIYAYHDGESCRRVAEFMNL